MLPPDYQSVMRPILKVLADGGERQFHVHEIREQVATDMKCVPEGDQENKKFVGMVGWGIKHLKQAVLLKKVDRGVYQILQKGRGLLSDPSISRITYSLLKEISTEYREWIEKGSRQSSRDEGWQIQEDELDESEESPEATLARVDRELGALLASGILESGILEQICGESSRLLEKIACDLLVKMGYGEKGCVTGGPNDGGIDVEIRKDKLGLEVVCIQAKRYARERTVGGKDLREFAGALEHRGADEGVFVTTASFTKHAREFVKGKRIVLIDGEELVRLMVQYGVGVRIRHHKIPKIDKDYLVGKES